MKRFKNILVVVDDDSDLKKNSAIALGAELAKQNNSRLTLMDVIRAPDDAIREYKGIIKAGQLIHMIVAQRVKDLNSAADFFCDTIDREVIVNIGYDFIEVVRQVLFGKHDLVIKVANEHPDSFDNSDFNLMRKCPRPVWMLKPNNLSPNNKAQCQKVLATVDLALENNSEGKALNTLIMDLATSLAHWQNSELHVFSCWALYGESSLRDSGFLKVSNDRLQEILKEEERLNQSKLKALVDRYSAYSIKPHLVKGHPVDHIPEFTNKNKIDVVVMGTVARTGIPGLLIGNTAETVLHLINSSVITVKPDGFETPIK
jgi:universal stress protein E